MHKLHANTTSFHIRDLSLSALWCVWGCPRPLPRGLGTTVHQFLIFYGKILTQKYMNCELPDIQAGFRKGRGNRDQVANIWWMIEKVREFQKNIYFCFTDYVKAFDCVDHNKLWKILKEMGIPDHLICLLRNLYAGQEATVRTRHGTTDWFQIGKGVHQGCILSPCFI